MSDESTGGIEHAVSQRDVDVHRTVDTDGTGVVATVELRSTADEPVLVEVVDTLPDDLPVESAGFKPEAMPDSKAASDDRLAFEQAVVDEPEEVVYGLALSEPVEDLDLGEPVVEAVEPVAAGVAADQSADTTTPDEESGDPGGSDDAEEGDGTEATDDAGTVAWAETDERPSDSTADGPQPASEEGGEPSRRRSVDVRLDQLSARVEEFAAYAESLQTLVDTHGTPPEFVDRFDERIDEVTEQVADARTEVDETVGTVREDVDSLDDEVARLRDDLDEVAASMEQVREETATLREELSELQSMRGSLSEALAEWTTQPPEAGDESDTDAESTPAVTLTDPDD